MFRKGLAFGAGIGVAFITTIVLYAVASYPTSVSSFAVRENGQTIDANWFNPAYDEIVAIEGNLLNGFAHHLKGGTDNTYDVGVSGAKFRDLNLGRNAAIGGTLTVTGVSAFPSGAVGAPSLGVGAATVGIYSSGSNALDFSTNSLKALGIDSTQFIDSPTQPRASAYNNATQSVPDVTATALTLNSEDYDVGAMHDTGSNTSRATIPTGGDGLYHVTGMTNFAAGTSGARQLAIRKNGTTVYPGFIVTSATIVGAVVSIDLVLAAGDYVELIATQNSGGNMNIGSGTRDTASTLQAVKLW